MKPVVVWLQIRSSTHALVAELQGVIAVAERITEHSKEVFDNLRLNDFKNLVLMATHMEVNDEQVNVDVICAFDGEPEDVLNARDEGGEIAFVPLLVVVDTRNIHLLTPPAEAVLDASDAPPEGVDPPPEPKSMPDWPDVSGPSEGPSEAV